MSNLFKDALAQTETAHDRIDPTRMAQAAAMLGLGADSLADLSRKGTALPPLFHLFFANNTADAALLDHDGHEKLGRFIPDVTKAGPYHRRMWAAGNITFDGALKVGEAMSRTSTLRDVVEKEGRTGKLIFVTVDRVMETASGKVTEERILVYREGMYREKNTSSTLAPESLPIPPTDGLTSVHHWTPDYIQLFRFSALTWNSHRIHYDLDHCRNDEGYPDIITHGPFTALMLANLTADGVRFSGDISPLKSFRFRGTQTLYANHGVDLALNADGTTAEACNHMGQQAMTAQRQF